MAGTFLWVWALATLAAVVGHHTLPAAGSRYHRALLWALALALPATGVAAWAVGWLHGHGPAALADALMPSRGVLPAAHYQARVWRAGFWLVMGLGGAYGLAVLWALRARWARFWQHRKVQRGAWLLAGLVGLFVAFNMWQHGRFLQPHPVFYTDCRKVWGHRGHPEPPDIPENTIASYRRAFDLGAPGVEMDVRYDPQRGEYFIGRYDRGQEPPPGQRLLLQQVLEAVGQRGYFWLDIKTIRYLSPDQARQAAHDLAALLDAYGARDRAIVESDRPENLAYFARAGLHTSYWIFNIDEDAFPRTPWGLWWALVQVKENYIRGGFSAISMDRRFYTPMVAWMLYGARVHLFTVDDEASLRALVRRPQVRVILTNTARYDITACPERR